MPGCLYLVGTPIGNLDDLTFRALRILKQVPIIAAENPERTSLLCAHYAIETPLTSYHHHNKEEKASVLIARLQAGQDVALVSDAGMPLLCDPGLLLVTRALAVGIPVVPVPGASAALAALLASGLPADTFLVLGALPRGTALCRKSLIALRRDPRTLIAFEFPRRIRATLQMFSEVLGNRQTVLAMDLTTDQERFLRGTTEGILQSLTTAPRCREVTLVIEGFREGVREGVRRRDYKGLKNTSNVHQVSARRRIRTL